MVFFSFYRKKETLLYFWIFFSILAQSHSSLNEEKEDFGVAETETLQHFTRPKPPTRRRPKNTIKVTPILTDLQEEFDENDLEINQKVLKKAVIVNKGHGSKSKEEIHNGQKNISSLKRMFPITNKKKVSYSGFPKIRSS